MRRALRERTIEAVAIRVLIVDDFQPFREMLRFIFALDDELEVVGEAATGLDGAAAAGELQPDVVILDCILPDVSGAEAAERIHHADPHARILACSVMEQELEQHRVAGTAVSEYLDKGVAMREWLMAVRGRATGATATPAAPTAPT